MMVIWIDIMYLLLAPTVQANDYLETMKQFRAFLVGTRINH